jgi:hypothetical protein
MQYIHKREAKSRAAWLCRWHLPSDRRVNLVRRSNPPLSRGRRRRSSSMAVPVGVLVHGCRRWHSLPTVGRFTCSCGFQPLHWLLSSSLVLHPAAGPSLSSQHFQPFIAMWVLWLTPALDSPCPDPVHMVR